MNPLRLQAIALAALAATSATSAHAAQPQDSCTGYIEALPATIGTQGTWCLRGHLYTSQTSGAAITVLTDNVAIDCGHFRLSGYGAGVATDAIGITTGASRLGASVRRCRIQGFKYGVVMYGANHLVEDNRFDGNRLVGIHASGDHPVIRNNAVMNTGGRPGEQAAFGISASAVAARVSGNTVHGVVPAGNGFGQRYPRGIHAVGAIEDNHVSGLETGGNGHAWGIIGLGRSVIRRNTLVQAAATTGLGVMGNGAYSVCRDNDIINYEIGISAESCALAGHNMFLAGVF